MDAAKIIECLLSEKIGCHNMGKEMIIPFTVLYTKTCTKQTSEAFKTFFH